MNDIPCDIVLLPNDTLSRAAISLSRKLKEHDSLFTLEEGKYYPHLSLYMFQLESDDIPTVENALRQIAERSGVVELEATKFCLGEGYAAGYVDPEYAITPELRSIQEKVIESVNPIRSGMREKDKAKMVGATGAKLENLKKFGYPSIGPLFRPHVTLTRLQSYKPDLLDDFPDITEFSGSFDRIGLFEMGDNGTCVRKILEVPLGSSAG